MNKSDRDCSDRLYREIGRRGCYYQGMRAAGFVLTGGNSSRMGSDKALLPLGDEHMVQVIATVVGSVVDLVKLIGNPARYGHLPWQCVADIRPGLGPLAGLESALASTEAELNLVVACDMPGLQTNWLRTLLDHAERSSAPCVATRDGSGKVHPLCAVYRRACLPTIKHALDQKRLQLTRVVESLAAEYLLTGDAVDNVNTPAEWAEWRRIHLSHAQ